MKKEGRKAQVTVFIIIGIILLVSAFIVIYMTNLRKVEVIEEVVVPPEVKPVYDYVTNCLFEIGTEGANIIGTQGGYADLSDERIDTRDITMTPSAYVEIDPAGNLKLPHWFYEGENRVPPIEFIQKELADYVNERLDSCINDFRDFEPQFQITALDEPVLSSTLTDEDVVIRLKYPIEIKEGESTTEHEDFISHLPVRLKKMWQLSKTILEKENEENILENLTIDLMAMSPDVPMGGFEIRCGINTWMLDDVEQTVQQLMRINIPKMRVMGTDYPPFLEDEDVYQELKEYDMGDINEGNLPDIKAPRDAFEYNKMTINPKIAGVEDMRVSFAYQPRWGMDLNALPNEAGMLRSNMAPGQKYLSFLCINTYHFVYDVIYPVVVRVNDPQAYDSQGFVFQFAFPVLINDNRASRESFGARLFQDYYVETGFCEKPGGPAVEIRVNGKDELGYSITSGIKDVNISYVCVNRRCQLGQTGYSPEAPGRYSLITSLPPGCSAPTIIAEKEGYLPAEKQLAGDSIEMEMTKLRKMPFTISKHVYSKFSEDIGPAQDMGVGDEAIVYMRLRGPQQFEQYFTAIYNDNRTNHIEFVDGEAQYDLDIMLYNYGLFVGGYKAENITLSYDDFGGLDNAEFHVFQYNPRPISAEDSAGMITYYMGEEYREELFPTFS